MASRSIASIGSGNEVMVAAWGHQAICWPMLTYHQWWLCISKIQTYPLMKRELGLGLRLQVYIVSPTVIVTSWDASQNLHINSHYSDVIMSAVPSQITGVTIIYPTICSDADQRKHQSSTSLAFVWGIDWLPVNFPQKGPVTRKRFPFDDVIMIK